MRYSSQVLGQLEGVMSGPSWTSDRDASPAERDPAALRPLSELSLSDDVVWELLDAAPDGVVVVDETGQIVLVNSQAEQLFGYERSELLGVPVEVLLPDPLQAGHRAHRLRYRAEPRTRPMGAGLELRARRADGTDLPVEIALSPLRGPDGVLTIASVRDVTDRKQAEAHARRVQQALDATHDGVYLYSLDTLRFVHVNQGAVAQSGYSRDELLEMTPLHLAPEFSEASLRQLLREVASGVVGGHREVRTVLRRKDGTDVPVEVMLELPAINDDRVEGWLVALVRDISERLQAEAQLQAAERQLPVSWHWSRIGNGSRGICTTG